MTDTDIKQQLQDLKGFKTFDIFCDMKLVLTFPDKRVRDLDNPLKPVLDALQRNEVLENDSLVQGLSITKQVIKDVALVELIITPHKEKAKEKLIYEVNKIAERLFGG